VDRSTSRPSAAADIDSCGRTICSRETVSPANVRAGWVHQLPSQPDVIAQTALRPAFDLARSRARGGQWLADLGQAARFGSAESAPGAARRDTTTPLFLEHRVIRVA
jgi:hypothetical protein